MIPFCGAHKPPTSRYTTNLFGAMFCCLALQRSLPLRDSLSQLLDLAYEQRDRL